MLLSFDTATSLVTVALHDGEDVVAERLSELPMKHGEHLAPLIEALLTDNGPVRRDLTAIAVGVGPGPFTGLRVGSGHRPHAGLRPGDPGLRRVHAGRPRDRGDRHRGRHR
ncbi:tRNA (adenosine(37)-N6)-threonylcarbamoyltransferase complex dimerization subunit type 1 TsaB [Nocardioides sp. B-3]|uniref:tRNA (adenosine(37)-N6)-threonylcarbamoyltransferase complex dimerization subunit type 1 TsaB n=1 Tax=Nocardioides sp. B-3 TaxID=2895565 RepID=UPI00300DC236